MHFDTMAFIEQLNLRPCSIKVVFKWQNIKDSSVGTSFPTNFSCCAGHYKICKGNSQP